MPDAPAVPAPALAAAPPAPEPTKIEQKPYRFKFTPGQSFSIDGFLTEGSMEGIVHLNEKLTVTFRTMSVDAIQKMEAGVDVTDQTKTLKYIQNELTFAQQYHTIQAMNGKTIPAIPADYWTKDYKPETDIRRKWLRNLPGVVFDQMTMALGEFDRHAKEIISPEGVRNF